MNQWLKLADRMMRDIKPEKQTIVSVETATEIILSNPGNFGSERIELDHSAGRILAQNVTSDIDFPPYDRITMDGIAIKFSAIQKGISGFRIKGVQGAGDININIENDDECVEVMTGASLPPSTDTVIRYEDVSINDGIAKISSAGFRKGQNIHFRGDDRRKGDIVVRSNETVCPATIAVLASAGLMQVEVKKLPSVMVVTTGNEIVEVDRLPGPFEIRNSNKHVIVSALRQLGISPKSMHLTDDRTVILENLKTALKDFDVLVICGGVSKGKFDFIPDALEQLGVKNSFHHVKQRPGKPFWYGMYRDKPVFAFPGNPASVFLCLYRYLLPWLKVSLGLKIESPTAVLSEEISFSPQLQYFIPVKLTVSGGSLNAFPVKTNGSGDFINLLRADAFMELPREKELFLKGETYTVWPFKNILHV